MSERVRGMKKPVWHACQLRGTVEIAVGSRVASLRSKSTVTEGASRKAADIRDERHLLPVIAERAVRTTEIASNLCSGPRTYVVEVEVRWRRGRGGRWRNFYRKARPVHDSRDSKRSRRINSEEDSKARRGNRKKI